MQVPRFGDNERASEGIALQDLADSFGFTLDELALNRAGHLSSHQRQRLAYRSVGYLVNGLGLVVLGTILTVAMEPRAYRPWQRSVLALVWMMLALFAILVAVSAWRVHSPAVHQVTGYVQRAGTARKPRVRAGELELRISFKRWKHLPTVYPGLFTVYYAGFIGDLLSLEPAV